MSIIESRRYGRRSITSFTREEFEQLRNTPRAYHTELRAESMRIMERMMKAQKHKNAVAQK